MDVGGCYVQLHWCSRQRWAPPLAQRLAQRLAKDPERYARLFTVVQDEVVEKVQNESTSCTKGLLWLKRCGPGRGLLLYHPWSWLPPPDPASAGRPCSACDTSWHSRVLYRARAGPWSSSARCSAAWTPTPPSSSAPRWMRRTAPR
jgi:hypothetical protein